MVMGGTWRIPVLMKLLDKNFVKDLKMDGTFNESSFEREYKNLYSINLVNCWELSLRQSAAKLAVSQEGSTTILRRSRAKRLEARDFTL